MSSFSSEGKKLSELIDQIEIICLKHNIKSITVLLNTEAEWCWIERLLSSPRVTSVILCEFQGLVPVSRLPEIGFFQRQPARWILPRQLGNAILFVGEMVKPTFPMALKAIMRGVLNYFTLTVCAWNKNSFARALIYRILRFAALRSWGGIRNLKYKGENPQGALLNRILYRLRVTEVGERLLLAFAEKQSKKTDLATKLFVHDPLLQDSENFISDRVLMVNSALAWGGAERQLTNSLIGLKKRGMKVSLICEALNVVPDSDFFRWLLVEQDIEVSPIRRSVSEYNGEIPMKSLIELSNRVACLPSPFRENVAPYAMEILLRKPQVVHAWQDQTNVMVGVAAAMVGVPKIVLSTRNMSPPNFSYFQPHMRDSYRMLSKLPNVRIINNSRAGLNDYASWLDLPANKFKLLYNGIDFSLFEKAEKEKSVSYRKSLGIADDKRVVGSVFRLYDEKDPFLWLDAASLIASRFPDTVFLIIGVGPLKDALFDYAAKHNLKERLWLPGTEKQLKLPLSIMEVFMLTSRFEGLPNVIIEAQSQGVPVVTTRAGGSGETIKSGETGWLVEKRSAQLLADRVCYVLSQSEWATQAGEKAVALVNRRFGLERMISETIAIYEDI